MKHTDAVMYPRRSATPKCCRNRWRVMDASAVAMCRDNNLPIMVFNLNTPGNIMRMATGEPIGTVITLNQSES